MLSFKAIDEFKTAALTSLSEEELEYLHELLEDIEATRDSDVEMAYTVVDFCLAVRVFDFGRYSFIFPIALSGRADEASAVDYINEYAIREEIERIFTDVPRECISLFTDKFRHLDIDAEDPYAESFRIKIKTECELLDSIQAFDSNGFSLSELKESDKSDYARLLRDTETNKYWGYDYKDDFSENVSDSFFIENARLEFTRGTAIALALKKNGTFVGEGTLYAFDGKGGCEIAIRLLSEARGKGLGNKSFYSLVEYAKMIGLVRISAYVDKRNAPSLAFCRNLMEISEESDTRVKFSYDLF